MAQLKINKQLLHGNQGKQKVSKYTLHLKVPPKLFSRLGVICFCQNSVMCLPFLSDICRKLLDIVI